jgi:hypothetical protein
LPFHILPQEMASPIRVGIDLLNTLTHGPAWWEDLLWYLWCMVAWCMGPVIGLVVLVLDVCSGFFVG